MLVFVQKKNHFVILNMVVTQELFSFLLYSETIPHDKPFHIRRLSLVKFGTNFQDVGSSISINCLKFCLNANSSKSFYASFTKIID